MAHDLSILRKTPLLHTDMFTAVLIASALAPAGGSAAAQSSPPVKTEGGVLVGTSGMTLYTFHKDGAGKSAYNGPCPENWPPLQTSAKDLGTRGYAVITREDGSKQWAYKGKPLYYWAKDMKPGDVSGDGVKGVWHAAKP
jgi:predicted lipoprotein with Yx(FWY)xxD motif